MHYAPLCEACRTHNPRTFHHGCQGCIERSRIAAQHTTLTDECVGYADSLFGVLPETHDDNRS